MTDPTVSIIIPTLSHLTTLPEALDSIRSQAVYQIQTICALDHPADPGAEEFLRESPGVELQIANRSLGFVGACQMGAAIAKGKYLMFLNDDATLQGDALEKLIMAMESDERVGIVQPLILSGDGDSIDSAGDLFSWWGFFAHVTNLEGDREGANPVFTAKGACMLIRRNIFEDLGGFRKGYHAYFEETDLCWRARLAGFEVKTILDSEVRHVGGLTTSRLMTPEQVNYLSYRNRLRSLLSNLSALSLTRVIPLHLIGCVIVAVAFTFQGKWRSAASIIRAWAWPLRNWDQMKRERAESTRQRKLTDSAVLRPELIQKMRLRRARDLLRGHLGRWYE